MLNTDIFFTGLTGWNKSSNYSTICLILLEQNTCGKGFNLIKMKKARMFGCFTSSYIRAIIGTLDSFY